jgi:tRNA (guanine9-N1)-methyltransferase
LCQNKAEKLEIRTARLPIGAYIDNLPTRKVLTVNQVFQILTEYIDKRDWKAAFEAVIPIRKYSQIGRRKQKKLAVPEGAADGDADGDDDDDEEAEEAEEAKETSAEISGAADTQSHHE